MAPMMAVAQVPTALTKAPAMQSASWSGMS
jgi:hypothetical protein